MIEIKHKPTGEVIYTHDGDTLAGADLSLKQLAYTDLQDKDLTEANLTKANLRKANLFCAYIERGKIVRELIKRHCE